MCTKLHPGMWSKLQNLSGFFKFLQVCDWLDRQISRRKETKMMKSPSLWHGPKSTTPIAHYYDIFLLFFQMTSIFMNATNKVMHPPKMSPTTFMKGIITELPRIYTGSIIHAILNTKTTLEHRNYTCCALFQRLKPFK